MKKDKWAIAILVIGAFLILIAPFLLTRQLGWIVFNDATGTIGDTIGGITAPITGLVGAFLVYRALQAQIEANKLIQTQFAKQQEDANYEKALANTMEQIRFLREDINQCSVAGMYQDSSEKTVLRQKHIATFKGVEGISYVLKYHNKIQAGFEKENLIGHLNQIDNLLDRILATNKLINAKQFCSEDKEYLIDTLASIYLRIFPYLYRYRKGLPGEMEQTCIILIKELNISVPIIDDALHWQP